MKRLLITGLCIGLGGCAATARQVSSEAVKGGVETIEQPEYLDRIDHITASPEFQHSVERVSRSLVRGAASGVEVDENELAVSTELIGAALSRGLVRGFREGAGDLGGMPDTRAIVDDAISGALASASSETNRARASAFASDVTGTIIRTALSSTAEGLEQDLNPSLDRVSGTAAPKLARILADEDFRAALGGMFREISRNTTLGVDAGMEQLRASNRSKQEGILGRGLVISMLAAAGLLVLVALVAIIVLSAINSRRRHEREEMLTSMLIAFAGHGAGLDEPTRTELLRQLGITNDVGMGSPHLQT